MVSSMKIESKIIEVLPLQSEEGKNVRWKKQDVILEKLVQYPTRICIDSWNDKIDNAFLQIENDLTIDVDIESRWYNGRWYTEVKAWRVALLLGEKTSAVESANTRFPEIDILSF